MYFCLELNIFGKATLPLKSLNLIRIIILNYKAIHILKTFSKDDVKQFKNFLNSPFFNTSNTLTRLYNSLIVFYPCFNSKFLSEEKLFKKVNPGRNFNKSTIKNLFADLAAASEKYFMHINFRNREIESYDFLRDEMFKRHLEKYLYDNIKKSELLLEKEINHDGNYFLNRMRLLTDKLNYQIINQPRANNSIISSNVDLFEERAKYITYYFVKEMIREYDNILTMGKTFRIDSEKSFVHKLFGKVNFEDLLNFLVQNSTNKKTGGIFEVYQSLLLAFSRFENEKHYYRYKKLLSQNIKYCGVNEIRFHTGRLIRYCINKCAIDNSREKFEKELFSVYIFVLSNKFYKSSISSFMPVELYRTILQFGLKMKKYKWIYEFINEYKSTLHPDRRKNMYNYSCAKYFFHRGRYGEAMKSFHKVELNHFMLKLDLKNLMLMTFYELNMYENAISLIDTYNHFLSNDKTLSTLEKRKHKNFVNIVQKMIAYKTFSNPIIKFDIEKGLENDLPEKEWVIEKMVELEKQYYKSA